ncbi:hypothetical protein SAMN05444401_0793 [Clostridium amylolyticum]|uniref:Uncharacterized protein n=1 Tax=Clostridium amylolyticum TaxID=1121298 RepID=A0A1M6BJF8_9CLOT|nr:hypothetical protein SAMN05444401_0793 [Clostridium amylolyticum]
MDKLTTETHGYHLALWTNRIKEFRASVLTLSRWCEQNNIGVKNYYFKTKTGTVTQLTNQLAV